MNREFFSLLSAFLNNEKLQDIKDYDWKNIAYLTDINNVEAMVYTAVKDIKEQVPEQYFLILKNIFVKTAALAFKREQALNNICSLFSSNAIEHFVVKGMVVKDYYPVSELRTMGDVDIVIKPEDMERAGRILAENGFEYDEFHSDANVKDYIRSGILFEVHSGLIFKNTIPGVRAKEYFSAPFKHIEQSNKYTKTINKEYHFIYLIVHMAKHFMLGGFGVRMLMDIGAFVNKFGNEACWAEIRKGLKELNMLSFTKVVMRMCNIVFNTKVPEEIGAADIAEDDIYKMLDYLISGGVFGYEGRNEDAIRINGSLENKDGIKGVFFRIKNILRWIFPSYEHMIEKYDWFKGKSKFFLPFGWIYCIWYRMVKNRENSLERVNNAIKSANDVKEHYEMEKLMKFGENKED